MKQKMVNQKNKRLLVIPVEVKARELHSRILLAMEAVSRGCRVLIGSQRSIWQLKGLYGGAVYFDKSMAVFYYDKLDAEGMIYVACDEEGLSADSASWYYLNKRHSKELFDRARYFFCWGEAEKELLDSEFSEYEEKCKVVGNCRADIWRKYHTGLYGVEARSHVVKYGRYVLIPMSYLLSPNRRQMRKQFDATGVFESSVGAEELRQITEFLNGSVTAMIELVKGVAVKFPAVNFVVRPHPSDWMEAWHGIFDDSANVEVVFEGVVGSWIGGSEAVLHCFCTTGLEAFLMGKPVVSYRYSTKHKYCDFIGSRLGIQADSRDDVANALAQILNGTDSARFTSGSEDEIKHQVYQGRAHRLILDHLMEMDEWGAGSLPKVSWAIRGRLTWGGVKESKGIRSLQKLIGHVFGKKERVGPSLKTSQIRLDEVEEIVRILAEEAELPLASVRLLVDSVFVLE